MKNIFIVILLAVIGVLGYMQFKPKEITIVSNSSGNDYQPVKNTPKNTTEKIADTVEWKTYSSTEYGFSFKYPSTWSLTESNAIDRTGKVLGHTIDLKNETTGTLAHVTYNTIGAENYNYFLPEYKKTMTQVQISGETAYMSSDLKSKDIKGNIYNPPERDFVVALLGKNSTDSFTISMQTPSDATESDMTKLFNLILQSFVK